MTGTARADSIQTQKHIDLVVKLDAPVVAFCEKLWASYQSAHKEIAPAIDADKAGKGISVICMAPPTPACFIRARMPANIRPLARSVIC